IFLIKIYMNKKVPVYGMHCKACELLIENKLSEMDGVTLKNISQSENCIEINIKTEKNLEEVKAAIEEL
ncbi:MAG TPA: heavy metal-associated domain-containing protein, partial [Ignavibacteriaceae bacterium]